MGLKPKYLWYCFTIAGFVLSFFFNVALPKDWAATLSFVDSLEFWWVAHAGHPLVSAFFAGLLFGTVLIPEIWRVFRDQMIPPEPRPDWNLQDAVEYLCTRSRWSIGRVYYRVDDDRLIEQDIDEVLRDAASQGRISLWGRPTQTGVDALFGRGIEEKIPVPDLQAMSLDLTTIGDSSAPHGAVLRAYSQDQYRFLRVNRRDVCREWPPASYWRLLFDRTWKSRRQKFVPNVAELR